MKKLTPERRALAQLHIVLAQDAMANVSGLSNTSEPWRKLMRIRWDAERIIQDELGLAMTKTWALLDGSKTFENFWHPDGTPKALAEQ